MEQTKHGHKLPEPILGNRTAGQVKFQATDQPQEPQVWLGGQIWKPMVQSLGYSLQGWGQTSEQLFRELPYLFIYDIFEK